MSLTLDIRTFVRKGWWRPDAGMRGSSIWSFRGQETGRIGWTAYPDSLVLSYATTDSRSERTVRDDLIPILQEVDRLGRKRICFVCPGCARYVLTLHAPTHRGAIWFRCRTCHGLSYTSRQEYTPLLGRLFNLLTRLEHRRMRSSGADRDALFEKAAAANAAFERQSEQRARHYPKYVIRRPPGRPTNQARQAEAAWLRSLDPPAPAPARRPPGRPKSKRPYVRRQPLELRPPSSDCEAYCVRCRDRRPLQRARRVTLSNRRPALRGRCAVCGTRLCRLLPSAQTEPALSTPVDRPGL